MIYFVAFLIALATVFIVVVAHFISVDWTSHLEMVKDCCDTYAWGTFAQFEREYAKRQWKQQADFPASHFSEWVNLHHDSKIHANIIKFDDVGMLLKPWDYFLFKLWEKNHVYKKPRNIEVPGHWSK